MVEDEVADGRRIAQLLSSELSGLSDGVLAEVAVVDADPDVDPTPEGAFAYGIEFAGERVGSVSVQPSRAVVTLDTPISPEPLSDRPDVRVADCDTGHRLVAERGAAVKALVDALRESLDAS